jgi:hypothetical protein
MKLNSWWSCVLKKKKNHTYISHDMRIQMDTMLILKHYTIVEVLWCFMDIILTEGNY